MAQNDKLKERLERMVSDLNIHADDHRVEMLKHGAKIEVLTEQRQDVEEILRKFCSNVEALKAPII